ncbi:hypothetical protein ACFOEQ_21725 [Chryseobacterium arachidis]|uniref:hypothetical protein n=1 Tax=Chryseobacterium arachidis TaxID=1416778 RepID=UPI003611D077
MLRIVILSGFLLLSCNPKAQDSPKTDDLKVEFSLPKKLKEVSGIAMSKDKKTIWSIEDQGNKNVVYGLDLQGNQTTDVLVNNADNNDWEDITADSQGNIYIGDFGNNENDRQNLSILKLDLKMLLKKQRMSFRLQHFITKDKRNFLQKNQIGCTIVRLS